MASLVCTLFEGHYHLGAAALLNSLYRNGFEGDFICGYRGPRPNWEQTAKVLLPHIRVHWLELKTSIHLTNYKPTFLKLVRTHFQSADACGMICYMDPDIVIKASWAVFERWALGGVAIVEDLNCNFPSGHPYRLAWHDLYARKGLRSEREMSRYYNAGFIAMPASYIELLDLWETIIGWAAEANTGLGTLKHASPHVLFHTPDQDALNMALELSLVPIHSVGPEGMDFAHGGHLLSHAAGGAKPWRGGFLRDALRGRPPGLPQKFFHDYVESPIRVLSPGLARWRKLQLSLASFIGRFYSRR